MTGCAAPHSEPARALFFTTHKSCDEALVDLSTAYNKLADEVERLWELEEQYGVLLQAAQEIETMAFRQYVDWVHFHELAMAKPFDAESEAQDFARRVSSLLTIALGDNTTIETSSPASRAGA